MTTEVETIGPAETLTVARQRMSEQRIHHLVVVDGRDIVGVLSSHDLAEAGSGRVGDRMSGPVVTVEPRTTLKQAANLLRGHAVGCLPVVERGKLAGIVTISDMLELLGRGMEKPVQQGKRWTLKHRGPRGTQQSRAKR